MVGATLHVAARRTGTPSPRGGQQTIRANETCLILLACDPAQHPPPAVFCRNPPVFREFAKADPFSAQAKQFSSVKQTPGSSVKNAIVSGCLHHRKFLFRKNASKDNQTRFQRNRVPHINRLRSAFPAKKCRPTRTDAWIRTERVSPTSPTPPRPCTALPLHPPCTPGRPGLL